MTQYPPTTKMSPAVPSRNFGSPHLNDSLRLAMAISASVAGGAHAQDDLSYSPHDQFVIRRIPGVPGGSTDVSNEGFIAFESSRWRVSAEDLEAAAETWCAQFETDRDAQFVNETAAESFLGLSRRVSLFECVETF